MPERVYISCDFNERELAEIKALCQFLSAQKFIIEFAPKDCHWSYRNIEEAIERCDVFVAGVGLSSSCSTWLAHEITYAFTLSQSRLEKRPTIFAIRLSNYDKPSFIEKHSENYPVIWLNVDTFSDLLKEKI